MTSASDVWRNATAFSILLVLVAILVLFVFEVLTKFRLIAIVLLTSVWIPVLLLLYATRPRFGVNVPSDHSRTGRSGA
ncbi:MAG TPA: hypothetical protein VJZ75_03180 [Candidatus Bathyarchaeia archaeon]|nr:hypothetical protein [Candidatus Bathyarchaeia archaeon]